MKKNCDNCKAKDLSFCLLGYSTVLINNNLFSVEKCPKPLTNKEFVRLHNERNRKESN